MTRKARIVAKVGILSAVVLMVGAIRLAALAEPPAPVITSPTNGQTFSNVPVTAAGTSQPGSFVSVVEGNAQIGGGWANGSGAWSASLQIGGGAHTIRAYAIGMDLSQSPLSSSVSFTVDAPPMAPVFSQPVQDSRTNQTTVTFVGQTDNGATVTLREGSTVLAADLPVVDRSFTTTLAFGAGTHTVAGIATDSQGRSSPSGSVRFTIDLTPPLAPSISSPVQAAAFPNGSVTVSGSAEGKATVRVFEGTTQLGTTTASSSGSWSIPVTGLVAGSHGITAQATDEAGNVGPSSAVRTFVVDETGPSVSFTTADNRVFLGAAMITGTASDNYRVARVRLVYETLTGTVARTVNSAACTGCGTASATWSDTPALATGVYTVTAVAYDTAGNVSVAETVTVVQA